MDDPGFWWELVGNLGAPVFAGALVACLLSGDLALDHGALMASGFAMMALSHWREHHHANRED